jgi:hypothetical protein
MPIKRSYYIPADKKLEYAEHPALTQSQLKEYQKNLSQIEKEKEKEK